MIDEYCNVEEGTHSDLYWKDKKSGMIVCTRHMNQFDKTPELGPYDWEQYNPHLVIDGVNIIRPIAYYPDTKELK